MSIRLHIDNRSTRLILTSVFWISMLSLLPFVIDACSNDENNDASSYEIPVSIIDTNSQSLEIQNSDENSLGLVNGTNPAVAVTGCASGNTQLAHIITSTVTLLLKDKNCLVRLVSFVYLTNTYSATATGATNFTTWLANDTATFVNVNTSTDTLKVTVTAQVTQSGVLNTDVVTYNFLTSTSSTTQTLAAPLIQTGVPLSVRGVTPNFTMAAARSLSVNANGSINMSFTLECGVTQTGSGATTACNGVLLQSTTPVYLNYILAPDIYSQGAITAAQLLTAFSTYTPTNIGTLVVAPGGSDLNGNTLPKGGFYTSNTTPLSTGSTPIYPNNTSYVFMMQQKDASGNTLGYLYFYVEIPASLWKVSACGSYFAGGSGTSIDPYQVNDQTTLANTALCVTSTTYFIQTGNITLSGSWTPIPLYGQYDGNNNSISGLSINRTTASASDGLFSTVNTGASILDLTISSATVSSSGSNIGILAGSVSGSITNCMTRGTVATQGTIATTVAMGGLIGSLASGGTVTTSESIASVTWGATTLTGTTVDLGGLVGNTSGTSITNSYYFGTITATQRVGTFVRNATGGLVGAVNAGTVTGSYARVIMTVNPATSLGSSYMGGLVGFTAASITLSQNFSAGSMTVTRANNAAVYYIGGHVGLNGTSGTISNSYSMVTMSVTTALAADFYGGFLGKGAAVSTCYSANPTMTATQGSAFVEPAGVTSITSSYYYANGSVAAQTAITGLTSLANSTLMQTQGSFTGFDFVTTPIWKMPTVNPLTGYASPLLSPVLNWSCGQYGIACTGSSLTSVLTNASFETGTFSGSSLDTFPSGDTSLSGWAIGGNSIDVVFTAWTSSNASRSIDLNGTTTGSMSQTVVTTPGTTYTLLFDLAENPSGPTVATMTVSAGTNVEYYNIAVAGRTTSVMGWTTNAFTFTASGTSTTITFTSTTSGGAGPAIDNLR